MSSQIKGGGKALLTRDCRQSMISLLMRLADDDDDDDEDANHDDDERDPCDNFSKHEQQRQEKKFVKQLVQQYERSRLAKKYNNHGKNSDGNTENGDVETGAKTQTPSKAAAATGNVRLELAEAIFKKDTKKNKPDKDKKHKAPKKSSSSKFPFQTGAKKVLVLPRSTTIAHLCQQAKSKLRIKSTPKRAFVVQPHSAILFDLEHDLSGIEDGTTVFVSSAAAEVKEKGKAEKHAAEDNTPTLSAPLKDPLEQVKRAYATQERRQQWRQRKSTSSSAAATAASAVRIDFDKAAEMAETRATLPAWTCKNDILVASQVHPVIVLSGATGSGKSTQVPQFLWEEMRQQQASTNNAHNTSTQQPRYIVVTQPRRVAAISLAQRVAEETGSPPPGKPGSLVGYIVRLDRKVADETCRIIYCTVGVLLRMLVCPQQEVVGSDDGSNLSPPALSLDTISHLVLDEVHERDVNTDFSLTLLRGLLASKQYPQLRLILMSATASSDFFVRYFASVTDAPPQSLEIPGRTFPVQVNWISDCQQFAGATLSAGHGIPNNARGPPSREGSTGSQIRPSLSPRAYQKIDNAIIRALIGKIVEKQQLDGELKVSSKSTKFRKTGAILVFLPGKAEIEALARCLYENKHLTGDRNLCNVLKLYSSMPRHEQQAVFQPASVGTVKIVLATNVAE
ncbi:MAG: hypothetical protein SGILL_006743 [Bacillariaceae sp.]